VIALQQNDIVRVLELLFQQKEHVLQGVRPAIYIVAEKDERRLWGQIAVDHDLRSFEIPVGVADEDRTTARSELDQPPLARAEL
jgi:hypothetical protein